RENNQIVMIKCVLLGQVQEKQQLTLAYFHVRKLNAENADTAFLTARGHAVVPAPLASTAVTPHTLLYGIHLYRPLYEEALQDCLPSALMLPGDYLCGVREMHETYQKWEFPQEGIVFS
ncbi:hypothetical protein E4U14_001330, partial [Claviceps sp. LM454 group G7]